MKNVLALQKLAPPATLGNCARRSAASKQCGGNSVLSLLLCRS